MSFSLWPLKDQSHRGTYSIVGHHPAEQDLEYNSSSFIDARLTPQSSFLATAESSASSSRTSSSPPTSTRCSSEDSSVYDSDTHEFGSPSIGHHKGARPRWSSERIFRKWKRNTRCLLPLYRFCKKITRFPYFPSQAAVILITLLIASVFALLLSCIIIHSLNPDKDPLPWREYCSTPPPSTVPPRFSSSPPPRFLLNSSLLPPTFPPADFEEHAPVGIFLGVFSMDQDVQRRMLIRSTWVKHPHSRNGAGAGDGGRGTSRTIVRFILGIPRKSWERRIQLEMESYNDIVILPIHENMNFGKTHAYFTWAASDAWVPPPHSDDVPYPVSYSDSTAAPPLLAAHDPRLPQSSMPWVRPDFVIKADDDTFAMLSELEARLRVAMYDATHAQNPVEAEIQPQDSSADLVSTTPSPSPLQDPLIYHGYLVKNAFMGGELYSLSWGMVDWVARSPVVRHIIRGPEDQLVGRWMYKHPRASDIRWIIDHCWIYDHPRAGTVYSHGFLFPSEVARIRETYKSYADSIMAAFSSVSAPNPSIPPESSPIQQHLSHSTVANYGTRYSSPLVNLTSEQSIEALVEGSAMSQIHDYIGIDIAWKDRESRKQRYWEQRVGGTVVVHSIKKHEWYMETALALLEGDETVEGE